MNQQTQLPTAVDEALAKTTREQRRNELAEISFEPGQMFQPKNSRELMDMASMMSGAGLMVKDIYRANPGACLGLIAVCAPYGLNPLQVSWKTYRASKSEDAPIAYEAQVVVAMVNSSNAIKGGLRYKFDGEGQNRRCCAYGTLRGDDEVLEVWSPPLSQISPKNSPLWKSDPDQQLCYYTGRSWVRRYKPEMLLGIYSTDELDGPIPGPDHARDVTPAHTPRKGGVVYADPDPVPEVDHIIDADTGEVSDPTPTEAEIAAAMEEARREAEERDGGAA
jgi:hypothetical protein